MKIIKKNICLIAILSGVVGLSACSQDDALAPDGGTDNGNTIRFTTSIARFTGSDATDDPGTRATIDPEDGTGSFADNDKTMIIGLAYIGTSPVTKEHPATYKDGTWITDMTWDEFGDVEWVRFSAFFPKRSLADFDENGQMEINPTDQSTPEKYAACDWISAAATGEKAEQPTIQLTFLHRMHRLTVNLSLSDSPGTLTQADVDNATVVIKNMETKGVVSFSGGVDPQKGNTGDFTPLKSASGNSFRVLLLPQSVTPGTPWIEITVGNRTVTYAVPDNLTALREGTEQVVNLKLTDSGATTAGTITLSGQKNTIAAGVGGKAEYDISTTDIDISNDLPFIMGATYTWYAAAEGGEPISPPTGINGYNLTSENDSKGVFSVKFLKTLSAGDYYFTVTYGGATSNRVKLTVG